MNAIFKHALSDKVIKWAIRISLALFAFQIILPAIFFSSLPPLIPLYNQMPWGEERLGTKIEIFLLPIIVGSFFLLNFFLLTRLYERVPLISRTLSITTMLVTLLSFIFIVRTLYLLLL